jgi:hypothetical protein
VSIDCDNNVMELERELDNWLIEPDNDLIMC